MCNMYREIVVMKGEDSGIRNKSQRVSERRWKHGGPESLSVNININITTAVSTHAVYWGVNKCGFKIVKVNSR